MVTRARVGAEGVTRPRMLVEVATRPRVGAEGVTRPRMAVEVATRHRVEAAEARVAAAQNTEPRYVASRYAKAPKDAAPCGQDEAWAESCLRRMNTFMTDLRLCEFLAFFPGGSDIFPTYQ